MRKFVIVFFVSSNMECFNFCQGFISKLILICSLNLTWNEVKIIELYTKETLVKNSNIT